MFRSNREGRSTVLTTGLLGTMSPASISAPGLSRFFLNWFGNLLDTSLVKVRAGKLVIPCEPEPSGMRSSVSAITQRSKSKIVGQAL